MSRWAQHIALAAAVCILSCYSEVAHAQIKLDSTALDSGSVQAPIDTNKVDSISAQQIDTLAFNPLTHKSDIDDQVDYEAQDSIILDLPNKKAYLYGKAKIFYQDITLQAEYIIIDFDKKDVFATGIVNDTTGKYVGRPNFEDAGKVYEADTMRYNFETKKGVSFGVLTTEKDGFIHGERILRDSNESIYVKDARFTTCNLPEPHFHISANKIKIIPKKQIITGPANLVISDIKTPLFVPFGFFPIPEKRKHGIIFPQFGESQERGFNARGLGYYFPINDFFDFQVGTDLYFRGGFAINTRMNYFRKYKYRGSFTFNFNRNERGEPESPNFVASNDYRVGWNYTQDAKSKPGRNFRASVDFRTSSFNRNNTTDAQNLIATNSNSSVSYSKGFFNRKLNMNVVSNMNQNLSTGRLDLTLPQLTLNASRQMPFKNFTSESKTTKSFMRNLGISYQGTFKNQISTGDSILVSSVGEIFGRPTLSTPTNIFDDFRNGVSHTIPIATSFKALRWVTVSPSFNFNEYWYFRTTEKQWDTTADTLIETQVAGFERAHSYRLSMNFSTILYGMKIFKKGSKLQAIRHVARPNMGFSWNPDFTTGEQNGIRQFTDSTLSVREYSIFENGVVNGPSGGSNASLNFGLGNNLEIKIKSKKDTANGGIKKIKIIENLNINSGYNFLADSNHLRNFNIRGNTTILDRIRITFTSVFDPYAYRLDEDGTGRRVASFALDEMDKLGHFTSSNLSINASLNPEAKKPKESETADEQELDFINRNMDAYVDFNIPWDVSFNYSINATRQVLGDRNLNQLLGIQGEINITPNWKIDFRTDYNIKDKDLSFASINLFRDLHCWQMRFEWIPVGQQMFSFGINVKSSTLQDLKLNRRRSWFDF